MLHLKLATDPRWANIAEKSLEEILTDHAFCEQKAATSGITMIVRFPQEKIIVDEMMSLVAEEWGHFRKVVKELERRGLQLGRQRKDDYVIKLKELQKKNVSYNEMVVEYLLINAMIEARSCERFRLLSLHVNDEELRKFYHEFMVSEAGHYRMFTDLARNYMPAEYVKQRWEEILDGEAEILKNLELRGDRVH